MPPTLGIRLLGALDLRLGDMPLPPLESARAESLLAYLLIHRDAPQPRQRLAFLLWPDSSEPQARTNLRHVLHTLRRALPEPDVYLDVTPRTLRWRPDAPFRLDLAVYEEALARGALREAADAYTGDLLEGCYDEWLLEERDRLRETQLEVLERLCGELEEQGAHGDAVHYAERMLRLDPLREETYRLLMRLHDARGNRARALQAYHACAAALERDLGVAPSAATRAAHDALMPGLPEPQGQEPLAAPVLVGRARERARLVELWRESEQGRSQLVLVTGEPGIGKTRLIHELRSWCTHRGIATAEARSYAAEGALAYGPVAAWLRSQPLAARRDRLDRHRRAELARVLPELGAAPELPLPESEQRLRLFDALAHAILSPAAPLLLIADDVHWFDAETLRFLHYLLRSEPDAPLLLVATARSEELGPGHPLSELAAAVRTRERLAEIELRRLSREETAVLAERFGGRPLEPADADRLFADTEGNPLFVVETLRAGGAISPRVQAVIEERLDRLSEPARNLAAIAATVGREFTTDVLGRAGGAADDALVPALDELWRRRIVADSGPGAYDFTHDRIREVAYGTLGPALRRRNHLAVARALAALQPGDAGQVAAHYDRAGAAEDAVAWYERAADAAQRRYANADAVRLLERALELQRDPARELQLTTTLLAPAAIVGGYGSRLLAARQQRALDLSRQLGLEPAPPLLRSLALAGFVAGDFTRARGFGEQLRSRGEREGDDVLLAESGYVLGIAAFWQAELAAARHHFEEALASYRPEHHTTHLIRYGLDPQVVCMSRLANTLAFLGHPEDATRARDRALALAEEIAHPPTRGTALTFAAMLAIDLGDADAIRRFTAALLAQVPGGGKAVAAGAEALAGHVDVLDGRRDPGLARIQRALEASAEIEHAPGQRSMIVRILLDACRIAGDPEAGIAAAAIPVRTRLWEAETLLLQARFRAALGAPEEEVEADRRRARRAAEERSRNASAPILAA